jgi:hypothetical protein
MGIGPSVLSDSAALTLKAPASSPRTRTPHGLRLMAASMLHAASSKRPALFSIERGLVKSSKNHVESSLHLHSHMHQFCASLVHRGQVSEALGACKLGQVRDDHGG